MPDLTDGPIISGPRYPSTMDEWPGSTVDLGPVELGGAAFDAADLTGTVAHWYAAYLGARPHVLDHNADPKHRREVMKRLRDDAKFLFEMTAKPPYTPPVVLSDIDGD